MDDTVLVEFEIEDEEKEETGKTVKVYQTKGSGNLIRKSTGLTEIKVLTKQLAASSSPAPNTRTGIF